MNKMKMAIAILNAGRSYDEAAAVTGISVSKVIIEWGKYSTKAEQHKR